MQTPFLTPSSLFEEQKRRDTVKLETYNRILNAIHVKIKTTSQLPSSPQLIYYDVIDWQPGCPSFDVKDCILYLVWQLRSSGFRVLYVSPNRLLISWKEHSIEYYQKESPIRQAILSTVNAVAPPEPTPSQATKKKPSSYKPATSAPISQSSKSITFI